MKITFVGVGSAFAGRKLGQSNMVLESDDGHKLLIDCGTRSQDMIEDHYGIGNADLGQIEGVYITHQHADHVGGLEWLSLCTYFNPQIGKPKLYCEPGLMKTLWDETLQGGLKTLQVKVAHLTDFFECIGTPVNDSFVWRGMRLSPVQTVHVVNGYGIQNCYGLMIQRAATDGITVFLTGDTQFAPNQLKNFYDEADVVLHDCETTPFRSDVHAHYDDLRDLPEGTKSKMHLYHYNSPQDQEKAKGDGFAGFIEVGQSFEF